MDQIVAQQVCRKSEKKIVENSPRAETVATAAMLALSNTTNTMRCHLQD
jgi:hypothetical protein